MYGDIDYIFVGSLRLPPFQVMATSQSGEDVPG